MRGFSERVGILENDLHLRGGDCAWPVASFGSMVSPLTGTSPAVGVWRIKHAAAGGRFAAAALADERERFAALDREIDAVDSPHRDVRDPRRRATMP